MTKPQLKHHSQFGRALKTARLATGISQEAFALVSSRTYVSNLERGRKQPTIGKVDGLAEVLGLHPLTLIALSYLTMPTDAAIGSLVNHIALELATIAASLKASTK